MSKYYDWKFDLVVDGSPCLPQKTLPLFQRDPWPGGHRYSCVLSGKRVGKFFDYLARTKNSEVPDEVARKFFLGLSLSWERDENIPTEYFLNSVEEIDFDGEQIHFSGICSPVVRR